MDIIKQSYSAKDYMYVYGFTRSVVPYEYSYGGLMGAHCECTACGNARGSSFIDI